MHKFKRESTKDDLYTCPNENSIEVSGIAVHEYNRKSNRVDWCTSGTGNQIEVTIARVEHGI